MASDVSPIGCGVRVFPFPLPRPWRRPLSLMARGCQRETVPAGLAGRRPFAVSRKTASSGLQSFGQVLPTRQGLKLQRSIKDEDQQPSSNGRSPSFAVAWPGQSQSRTYSSAAGAHC